MRLTKEPVFSYDKETGATLCILTDTKQHEFIGVAQCHPDDIDMQNQMTGCEIAFRRAYIKYLKAVRDMEIVPQLNILKHMYTCMEQAADFNPKDNNARLMRRSIENYAAAADVIRENIRNNRNDLYKYMTEKGKLYQSIREKRNADKLN